MGGIKKEKLSLLPSLATILSSSTSPTHHLSPPPLSSLHPFFENLLSLSRSLSVTFSMCVLKTSTIVSAAILSSSPTCLRQSLRRHPPRLQINQAVGSLATSNRHAASDRRLAGKRLAVRRRIWEKGKGQSREKRCLDFPRLLYERQRPLRRS